jgi:hypothetical protein
MEECTLLDRHTDSGSIPDDCPLEDASNTSHNYERLQLKIRAGGNCNRFSPLVSIRVLILWPEEREEKMKRKFKGLIIPDRFPRDNINIDEKRQTYCDKSDCKKLYKNKHLEFNCNDCLFSVTNVDNFEVWYLNKNKTIGPVEENPNKNQQM